MRCAVPSCGREIPEGETVWYEVIGWERGRKQANAVAMINRRRTGTVMCDQCRVRIQHTGQPGQGELFAQGT